MAEIVMRKGHLSGYSVVENRHLRRLDLSAGARAVVAYLVTLPDGWVLQREDLRARFPLDSERDFRKWMKELRELGYVKLVRLVDGKGKSSFRGSRLTFCPDVAEPVRHRKRMPSHLEEVEQPGYDAPDVLTDGLGPGREPE